MELYVRWEKILTESTSDKTKQKTSVQMCLPGKINVPKVFISIKRMYKLDLCFLDLAFL